MVRDYMEELASEWVGWLRYRNAVQEKVVELIRRTNAKFENDEDRRQVELKSLQRSFYRVSIAEKLVESGRYEASAPSDLLIEAEKILDKAGHKSGSRGPSSEYRTADEERYYGTVRVRWSNLLKKARVSAADPRGGDTSSYRRSRFDEAR